MCAKISFLRSLRNLNGGINKNDTHSKQRQYTSYTFFLSLLRDIRDENFK